MTGRKSGKDGGAAGRGESKGAGRLVAEPPGSPKCELDLRRLADEGADEGALIGVIKVSEADYVPAGVSVRARFSPHLFSAEISRALIDQLEEDERVASIGTAQRLRQVGDNG